jgi:hypothetical protein
MRDAKGYAISDLCIMTSCIMSKCTVVAILRRIEKSLKEFLVDIDRRIFRAWSSISVDH